MKKVMFALLVLLATAAGLRAQSTEVRKKAFNHEKSGLAIQGYDPVAYFTGHKAVEGKKEISTFYNGITYRFSPAKKLWFTIRHTIEAAGNSCGTLSMVIC